MKTVYKFRTSFVDMPRTLNVMFWINIVLSLGNSFVGNWLMAGIFLSCASSFLAADLAVKEMKKNENS